MSTEKRFLFDECVGEPVMEQLHALVSTDAKFVHITDYFRQGEKDESWIPRLGIEGGWVVITSDGGKQSKRGQKLPDLCREHHVTHVILSTSLHRKKSHEKAGVLTIVWSEIEALHQLEPGTRFHLRYKSMKGKTGLAVLLEPVPLPIPPEVDSNPSDSASSENGGTVH